MDEEYVLVTPENVPISYELAGVGSRFVAALLDTLIISAIEVGLVVLYMLASMLSTLASSFSEAASTVAAGVAMLGLVVVLLLTMALLLGYPLLFEIVWNGQTPGKRMAGIRVVQGDGGPIMPLAAVIRNVMRLVDFLPMYYTMGVVVMLIDKKGRRFGDMAAGTICVKERGDVAVDDLILAPDEDTADEPDAEGGFDNLDRLSDDDRYLAREYLLRYDQMAPAQAHKLGVQIAKRIAARLEVDLGDEPAEDFLDRVDDALVRRSRERARKLKV